MLELEGRSFWLGHRREHVCQTTKIFSLPWFKKTFLRSTAWLELEGRSSWLGYCGEQHYKKTTKVKRLEIDFRRQNRNIIKVNRVRFRVRGYSKSEMFISRLVYLPMFLLTFVCFLMFYSQSIDFEVYFRCFLLTFVVFSDVYGLTIVTYEWVIGSAKTF